MFKQVAFILATVAASMAAPAFAINKCMGADGKAVFQDAPCAGHGQKIEVKPASGNAPAAGSAAPAPGTVASPSSPKKEGAFGESWQRRTYLENRGVPDARGAVDAHRTQCEAKQRSLAAKKGSARNNLAGATWEQSISTEMQAAATVCDTKARELKAQLEDMEKELRELKSAGF